MKIESLSAKIEYRITVSKQDAKNICLDMNREIGFYWLEHFNATDEQKRFIEQQTEKLLSQIKDLSEIPNILKTVEVLENTEAVKVRVYVGFEGTEENNNTIYFNGSHRLNAEFEYFHEF